MTNAPSCNAHQTLRERCSICELYWCPQCDVLASLHTPRANPTAAHRARALNYSLARFTGEAVRNAWIERGEFGGFFELPAVAQAIADTLKGEVKPTMSCYEVVRQIDGRWVVRWEGSSYHLGHDPNLFGTRAEADTEACARNARDGVPDPSSGGPFADVDKPRV